MTEDIYFTSDTHWGHEKLLGLGNGRPFADILEHDAALIERWNERVKPHDRIYHLGDFTFLKSNEIARILQVLHGRKFFLWGNHDKPMQKVLGYFEEVYDYKEIKVGEQKLVLFHYPIASWHHVGRGSWHLHGHCHGNLPVTDMARMDIGVDTHDFYPWHIDEVAEVLSKRDGLPGDHHG